ncbi:hypothetical protein BFP72_08785 [Reichenbachiella sp. 5M10]|uniref:hypothetical protein n=1 Tax=Reichenbachiella sp. 5M10 TaxID=1889772 RepID=UPI000C16222E|nr:hypothetical protein [Reichenbachiella sp. 5M10]PIB35480.1 hypothetical protein BFP72_08785 [Reichenbachiella sp. 5M10]
MKVKQYLSQAFLAALVVATFSCKDDDELALISSEFDYKSGDAVDIQFIVNDDTGDVSETIDIADLANRTDEFYVRLTFTDADKNMERLYSNQNIDGAGVKAHKLTDNALSDGSLVIDSHDQDDFDLVIPFPVLNSEQIEDGKSVVYQIWTTDGEGEFDNPNRNFTMGIATLTVNY